MNITIPPQLLPADARFGSGPTRVRADQVQALAAANPRVLGTSHRQPPVKDLVGEVRSLLLELFSAPDGYEVILGNGGASLFWDAATFHLIHRHAQFAESGEFGAKFAAAAKQAPWLEEPEVISGPPGTSAVPAASALIDTYAWVHNETSTGVLNPVARVEGAARNALMVVDGTSAAGGVRIDLAEVDAYYFSPQKALGSEGGLWMSFVSPAAIERIEELASRWTPASLSLSVALANSRQNQTLNTPSISTLLLIRSQLQWFAENGGLEFAAARSAESSRILYSWAEESSYAAPWVAPEHRSPVVATIDFDDALDASAITTALRANGVVDVEPYRKLGRNQIRVGTYPSVDPDDVRALLTCIEYVVERL